MTRSIVRRVACAAALALACGHNSDRAYEGDPGTGVLIEPGLLFPGKVIVVPGSRWRQHAPPSGTSYWAFNGAANLLSVVRGSQAEPLSIHLRPDKVTADFIFEATWNGAGIEVSRQPDGFSLEVPADLLTDGHHRLRIDRRYPHGSFATAEHTNLFTELTYSLGAETTVLPPADSSRQRLLTEHLQHGVTGRGLERRGGLLSVGASRHQVPLAASHTSRLAGWRFEPENFSTRPAVFRLIADDREAATKVKPGGRGSLALEPPAGARELVLEVEGHADGLFLWGMPLHEPPSSDLTPIVLLTLDTTRRDALSPYSGRVDVTPVVDRFARQATVFENAFSTAPWTLPSHASIFTGLYPSRHGAGVTEPLLTPESVTLADLTRGRGYINAGFSAGELSSSRFGLAQGFHHYRNPDQYETLGGQMAEYVDEFLDRYHTQPLFLFVNYFDPHAVYRAPAKIAKRFGVPDKAARIRHLPVWGDLLAGRMEAWRAAVEGKAPLTPEVKDYLQAAYLAEVAYVDALIGRLFDRLRQLELFDRALIVLTADHGELLGEGGYVHHAARLDPELVEIPLIIKWPGQEHGGRVSELVSLIDLFPTILAAAGIEAPASDGQALAASGWATSGAGPRPFVLFEEHHALVHPLHKYMMVSRHLFGVQRPAYRQLVWDAGAECARLEEGAWHHAPCTAKRAQVLQSVKVALEARDGETIDAPPSDELRESLKALGYL